MIQSISAKVKVNHESLRQWVRRAETDAGFRPGLTTDERAQMKELERENRELRRANEIRWGRENPLRARADHVDATLAAAGRQVEPGEPDDPLCAAEGVAAELDIFVSSARRWMADGTAPTVVAPVDTGVRRRWVRLSDIWAHRDRLAGRLVLPDVGGQHRRLAGQEWGACGRPRHRYLRRPVRHPVLRCGRMDGAPGAPEAGTAEAAVPVAEVARFTGHTSAELVDLVKARILQ